MWGRLQDCTRVTLAAVFVHCAQHPFFPSMGMCFHFKLQCRKAGDGLLLFRNFPVFFAIGSAAKQKFWSLNCVLLCKGVDQKVVKWRKKFSFFLMIFSAYQHFWETQAMLLSDVGPKGWHTTIYSYFMGKQQGTKRLSNLSRMEQETTSSNLSLGALSCILKKINIHWPGGGNSGIANAGASKKPFFQKE